uniref:Uncharacterized protein n=1 Tax=Compsopogon caeruleus TaxID=31354 RepID=A0A6T6CG01_9RHOD|mmetsp:Transcript_4649/g.9333  ORF Transcript_4649/g.9333 Transcript_4649/m.9333 type:complete len:254 (+) Transcript_4649:2486-3247(+)
MAAVKVDMGEPESRQHHEGPSGQTGSFPEHTPGEPVAPLGESKHARLATKADVARMRDLVLAHKDSRAYFRAVARVFFWVMQGFLLAVALAVLGWSYFFFVKAPSTAITICYLLMTVFVMGGVLCELVRSLIKVQTLRRKGPRSLSAAYYLIAMKVCARLFSSIAAVLLVPVVVYLCLVVQNNTAVYLTEAIGIARYFLWVLAALASLVAIFAVWRMVLLVGKMEDIRGVFLLQDEVVKRTEFERRVRELEVT